jgi:hypothetical protein
MFSRLAVAFFATLAVSAAAAPSKVFDGGDYASKIDYSPPITAPAGGEVFIAGQTATVTWDNTVVYDLSNVSTTADLVLGYTEEGSSSLNLGESRRNLCSDTSRSKGWQMVHERDEPASSAKMA